MYAEHVPTICAAMRADPDTFVRGAMFAILSMRQKIYDVPHQMADLDREGEQSRWLFGHKAGAYRYLTEHKVQLWQDVCAATDTAEAIRVLCQIPGLGIIKSAFILQFMGFDVACLDSRNMAQQGRSTEEYRTSTAIKRSPKLGRLIAAYVAETVGLARTLWDTWCADAGAAYGFTAEAISKLHYDTIVPRGFTAPQIACPFIGVSADAIPF